MTFEVISWSSSNPVVSRSSSLRSERGNKLSAVTVSVRSYTGPLSADLVRAASELFDVVQRGAVKIEINQRYQLRDAAAAHRDLEGRRTTGSTVLLP